MAKGFLSPDELKAAWDGGSSTPYFDHCPTQEEVDEAVLMMRLKAVAEATQKQLVEEIEKMGLGRLGSIFIPHFIWEQFKQSLKETDIEEVMEDGQQD